MNSYDYIIAGAGASGLTLATLLVQKLDDQKSILIIDKDDKSTNDRTWSFWEQGENLFEEIVHWSWPKAIIKGRSFEALYELAPYRYKTIRGKDFYDTLVPKLKASPNVTWIQSEIISVKPQGEVHTPDGLFKGKTVFNSTINYQALDFEGANNMLQHFKGWIIKTEENHFDPETVTYMDFTPDQEGDCRFGYVLPFAGNEALVEYTLFNKTLLTDEQYDQKLKDYIKSLGIEQYKIKEVEKGVIPMTDYRFKIKESQQLYNIGILGGFAKASTGYSFLRAQHILQKMADNIDLGKPVTHKLPYQQEKFKIYDATLLDVLASGKYTGEEIFTNLFKKNGAHQVFRFLDEQTSLSEELRIMSSTPILDFGRSFLRQIAK